MYRELLTKSHNNLRKFKENLGIYLKRSGILCSQEQITSNKLISYVDLHVHVLDFTCSEMRLLLMLYEYSKVI